MTNENLTQHQVFKEAEFLAKDLFEQALMAEDDFDEAVDWAYDHVHEWVDGHQWVIYYSRAHQLIAAVGGDEGETMLEDMGWQPKSYDEYATAIAFGQLVHMVSEELINLVETKRDERNAA